LKNVQNAKEKTFHFITMSQEQLKVQYIFEERKRSMKENCLWGRCKKKVKKTNNSAFSATHTYIKLTLVSFFYFSLFMHLPLRDLNDYLFPFHLHESKIVLTRILLPLPHLDLSQLVLQLQEPLGDRGLLHQQPLEQAVQVGNLSANFFSRCILTILGFENRWPGGSPWPPW